MWPRTRLLEIVEDVRASYWFVPALLALAGFAAGLASVYLDAVLGDAWLGRFEWFYGSRPAGARSLLSTVAGSTITVAGVSFSITLAAVTYASGQYGPRLLSNFAEDRGNQVSLGIFIGTFLYCLVVLRTIHSAEEASADSGGAVREAFVPHVAMFGGLALAILSIGVLIYFVHHVTDGIHINNVIAKIGRGLLHDISERAQGAARVDAPSCDWPEQPGATGIPAPAVKTGYVEAIDEDALLKAATEKDVVLTLLAIAGDFVHRGRPMLLVEPAGSAEIDGWVDYFSIGRKRSGQQDLRFALDELVEIAARALSPGVNDPFTAIGCIDWLGAALIELAAMTPPPTVLRDEKGRGRVIVPRLTFGDYLQSAVGQLRGYAAADPNAAAHLLKTLDRVKDAIDDPGQLALIAAEKDRVYRAMPEERGR